jgi:transcriptional regulator with XRE-family HTH domain
MNDGVIAARLAANLRRLRIARRLSLSQLARTTGASKATLSGIESARANPTMSTLAALAAALRVSLGELLDEPPAGEVRVVRAAQRPLQPDGEVRRRLIDELSAGGPVAVHELELPAHQLYLPPVGPPGARTHALVLEGTVIAGPLECASELGPGDYISFLSHIPHQLESTRRPARALLLLS